MKKELYSKENQQDILAEILNTGKRPDLSYLTQRKFSESETASHVFVVIKNEKINEIEVVSEWHKTDRNSKFSTAFSKLPELVQCAEILFDLTQNEHNSMNHKIVSDLLNSLKL